MRLKLAFAAVLVATAALVAGLTTAPASAGHGTINLNAVPVDGAIASTGGTFSGTLDISRFAVQNGRLTAIGTVDGTVTDAAGNPVGTVTDKAVSTPLASDETGSCQILDLTLGPLNLNLLGLVVHLDTVHLNITAQQGSGNLLGNLLCMVTHLLDGSGSLLGGTSSGLLTSITNLLNMVLARL